MGCVEGSGQRSAPSRGRSVGSPSEQASRTRDTRGTQGRKGLESQCGYLVPGRSVSHPTPNNSTSKTSVAFFGIAPGTPDFP